MTQTNNLTSPRPIHIEFLIRRMLIGTGIGLVAGSGGGLFTYMMEYLLGFQGSWSKIIAVLVSLIGFVIALWLGTVLGLAGTLWN